MRSFPCEQDGTSVIETALLLPVLVLMLVGAFDFGRAYYVALEVAGAAQAGAVYGTQNVTDTAGMIAAAKLDAADVSQLVPTASYGCECSDGSSGVVSCKTAPSCAFNVVNYVQVNTAATYTLLLPYPGLAKTLSLTGQARMRAAH